MRLLKVVPIDDRHLKLMFQDGDRIFDISPYIKRDWMGALGNPEYFRQVSIEPEFQDTVIWPDGQDIAPHELYELSVVA